VVINLIVLAVTLLMAAFLGVWIFFPRLRGWMEMPKYRFLEQQHRYPGVLRDPCRVQSAPTEPAEQSPTPASMF
jgi:hypothetical protein